jgi:hypothetical protein
MVVQSHRHRNWCAIKIAVAKLCRLLRVLCTVTDKSMRPSGAAPTSRFHPSTHSPPSPVHHTPIATTAAHLRPGTMEFQNRFNCFPSPYRPVFSSMISTQNSTHFRHPPRMPMYCSPNHPSNYRYAFTIFEDQKHTRIYARINPPPYPINYATKKLSSFNRYVCHQNKLLQQQLMQSIRHKLAVEQQQADKSSHHSAQNTPVTINPIKLQSHQTPVQYDATSLPEQVPVDVSTPSPTSVPITMVPKSTPPESPPEFTIMPAPEATPNAPSPTSVPITMVPQSTLPESTIMPAPEATPNASHNNKFYNVWKYSYDDNKDERSTMIGKGQHSLYNVWKYSYDDNKDERSTIGKGQQSLYNVWKYSYDDNNDEHSTIGKGQSLYNVWKYSYDDNLTATRDYKFIYLHNT